jgi:hypothetical protein
MANQFLVRRTDRDERRCCEALTAKSVRDARQVSPGRAALDISKERIVAGRLDE